MNFVEVAGFLGSDAEERFTPNGKRVVSFRVGARTRQGGKDETIWWRINIWGDRFDKMLPYLKKGTAIIVFGEMSKPETYVDKEGKTQITLTLTAEIVKFSPFGKSEKPQEATSAPAAMPAFENFAHGNAHHDGEMAGKPAGAAYNFNADFSNDDLPF